MEHPYVTYEDEYIESEWWALKQIWEKGLLYKGFKLADAAAPYFELWYLPFDESAEIPQFRPCVNAPATMSDGFTLFYTSQCPFTAKYVPLLCAAAEKRGVKLTSVHIDTREAAQNAPCPFTTFSLWHNGNFITHEIQSVPKFEKIIDGIV